MSKKKTTRRAFLKGSVAVGSAAFTAGTSVKAMEGDPLITEPNRKNGHNLQVTVSMQHHMVCQ